MDNTLDNKNNESFGATQENGLQANASDGGRKKLDAKKHS